MLVASRRCGGVGDGAGQGSAHSSEVVLLSWYRDGVGVGMGAGSAHSSLIGVVVIGVAGVEGEGEAVGGLVARRCLR